MDYLSYFEKIELVANIVTILGISGFVTAYLNSRHYKLSETYDYIFRSIKNTVFLFKNKIIVNLLQNESYLDDFIKLIKNQNKKYLDFYNDYYSDLSLNLREKDELLENKIIQEQIDANNEYWESEEYLNSQDYLDALEYQNLPDMDEKPECDCRLYNENGDVSQFITLADCKDFFNKMKPEQAVNIIYLTAINTRISDYKYPFEVLTPIYYLHNYNINEIVGNILDKDIDMFMDELTNFIVRPSIKMNRVFCKEIERYETEVYSKYSDILNIRINYKNIINESIKKENNGALGKYDEYVINKFSLMGHVTHYPEFNVHEYCLLYIKFYEACIIYYEEIKIMYKKYVIK